MLDRLILPELSFHFHGLNSYFPGYVRWLFKNVEKKSMRILIVNVCIKLNAKRNLNFAVSLCQILNPWEFH